MCKGLFRRWVARSWRGVQVACVLAGLLVTLFFLALTVSDVWYSKFLMVDKTRGSLVWASDRGSQWVVFTGG